MTALTRYDAACAALAAAVQADEVMAVRMDAQAIAAVARVAKNVDLEVDAIKLRTRAETKLGDMLREAEAAGIIAAHGGPRTKPKQDSDMESCSPATLKQIGVDNKLAAQARRLSGIGARAVEAMLHQFDEQSRARRRPAINVIREALASRNNESRRRLAQELSDCTALQPSGRKFPAIYADPAWRRKAGIGNRAYENQYVTMSWDDIIAMPVAKRVLPDAWLFLWVPRAHLLALHPVEIDTPLGRTKVKLPLAWAVAQAWGFDAYSTCAIWTKTDAEHPDDHGTGLIFWDQDEILCLFKRGRGLPMPAGVEKVGSNHREPAGRHSAKPAYYRDVINRMTGGVPVLELFAREDDDHPLPANFYTWGNQSNNTAELPAPTDADGAPVAHDHDTGEIVEESPVPQPQTEKECAGTNVVHGPGETRPHEMTGAAASLPDDDQLAIPAFLRRRADNELAEPEARP